MNLRSIVAVCLALLVAAAGCGGGGGGGTARLGTGVTGAPVFTSTAPTTATVGTAYSYTPTVTGVTPITVTVTTTLPSWLTFSGGTLSGTPGAGNVGLSVPITLRAANQRGNVTQTFQVDVATPTPPAFTSTPPTTGVVGQLYTYTVVTTGSPAPTLTVSGNPAWLTLNGNVLSGTPPTAGPTGTITLTATNSAGVQTQPFVINVAAAPTAPQITSALPPSSATVGTPYSFTVVATGNPAPTFTLSGNPTWLTINPTTGVLSGNPVAGPPSTITISASNVAGTAQQQFLLTVSSTPSAPAFTSNPPLTAVSTVLYTYNVVVTGAPTPALTAPTKPTWLTLTGNTLSGTPAISDAGNHNVVLVASNTQGAVQQAFTITVSFAPAAFVTTNVRDSARVGLTYIQTIIVTGTPVPVVNAQTIPGWLTLTAIPTNPTRYELGGTPGAGDVGQPNSVSLTAANGATVTAALNFSIRVDPQPAGGDLAFFSFIGQPGTQATADADFVDDTVLLKPVTMRRGPNNSLSTSALNHMGANDWPRDVASGGTGTIDLNDYFAFAVTPTAGKSISLSALEIEDERSGTGPRVFSIRSNRDGFAADLKVFNTNENIFPRPVQQTLLGAAFQNLATPVEFRIYAWNATAAAGSWRIQNVLLSGTGTVIGAGTAPQFTNPPAPTSVTVGNTYSYSIGVTGNPTPGITSTALPQWLTLNGTLLSGTPAFTDIGTVAVTLTASNTIQPDATRSFTIAVNAAPTAPTFTSVARTTAREGEAYSYTPVATGFPTPTLTASLPAGTWLSFNGTALTGTPTAANVGTHGPITITAANGVLPDATQTFSIVVAARPPAPAGNGLAVWTFEGPPQAPGDQQFSDADLLHPGIATPARITRGPTITTNAGGGSINASNWTANTTEDPGDYYELTLGPTAASTATFTSIVIDEQRSGTGPSEWSVKSSLDNYTARLATFVLPVGGSSSERKGQTTTLGSAFGGLTGPVSFRFYAYKSGGTGGTWRLNNVTVTGTIALPPAPPTFTSGTPPMTATEGVLYSHTLTATGSPAPTFSVSGNPGWLQLVGGNKLEGTPQFADVGTTGSITVTAANGVLPNATLAPFQITVSAAPQTAAITSAPVTTATFDAPYSYPVTVTGTAPITLVKTNGPAWLSFVGNTLQGTPGAGDLGPVAVTLTATNAFGSGTQSFTINVLPALLTEFNFQGPPISAGDEPFRNAEINHPHTVSPAAITRGPGVGLGVSAGRFSANTWPTATTASATQYFTFTVTPTAGKELNYTSLSFKESRNGNGPTQFAVRSSLDGFTGDLFTFVYPGGTGTGDTSERTHNVTLTAAFAGSLGAVEFRLFGSGAVQASGTWRLDEIRVFGTSAPQSATPAAPSFTTNAPLMVTVNAQYTYTFAATGTPTPANYSVTGLPGFLTRTGNTLAGMPGTAGTFGPITITAANGVAPVATQSFSITVTATPFPPTFTSTPITSATENAAYTYAFTATGNPNTITFNVLQMPGWLSPVGNSLQGTPLAADVGQPNTVSIEASNGVLPNTVQTFDIAVAAAGVPPQFTSAPPTATADASVPYSYQVTASGNPLPTFSLSGPAWLQVGLNTGLLEGTPTALNAGDNSFTLTASNGNAPNAVTTFAITVRTAPSITSAPVTTATFGEAYSYPVVVTGTAPITLTKTTGPTWLSFNGNTLQGTPGAADLGISSVSVTATNVLGSFVQSFTVTVSPAKLVEFTFQGPPISVGDEPFRNAELNHPHTVSPTTITRGPGIIATGSAGRFSANDWPGGTTLSADSYYTFTVTPTAGRELNLLELQFTERRTSTGIRDFVVRSSLDGFQANVFAFNVSNVNDETDRNQVVTLPPEFVGALGAIEFRFFAWGATGNAGTWRLDNIRVLGTSAPESASPMAPAFATTAPQAATVGALYSYTFAATGTPTPGNYTVTGLPGFLTRNGNTISGTPGATGIFGPITILASNGVPPDAPQTFSITVAPAPAAPAFTSTPITTAIEGAAYTYDFTATGVPNTITFDVTKKPGWLTIVGNSLQGMPGAGDVGQPNSVTITASNGVAPDAVQSFAINVSSATFAPTITSGTPPNAAVVGFAYSFTVTASGGPAPTFSLTGANWLTIDTNTGVLSGTPLAGDVGPHNYTVVATNASGSDQQNFSVDVLATGTAPSFTSTAPKAVTASSTTSYTMTANGTPSPTFAYTAGPTWITFVAPNQLQLSPTAGDVGLWGVTVTATNAVGTEKQEFKVAVFDAIGTSLLKFPFENAAGAAKFDATLVNTGIMTPVTMGGSADLTIVASTGDRLIASSWPNVASVNPATNTDYLKFVVTPKPGVVLRLTRLDLRFARSSTSGPANLEVRWNANGNGFATMLDKVVVTVDGNSNFQSKGFALEGATPIAITTTTEIRIYGYPATSASSTLRLENMNLSLPDIQLVGNAVGPDLRSSPGGDGEALQASFVDGAIPEGWTASGGVLVDHETALLVGSANLDTPPVSFAGVSDPVLRFLHSHDLPAGSIARVEISTDDGDTYRGLTSGGTFMGTPETEDFTWVTLDLAPDLAGEPLDAVRLRFVVYTEDPSALSTWRIDDVVAGDRSALPVLTQD